MAKADHPAFGDTSSWTEEDHAAANAERERDLATLPEGVDYEGRNYSQGYLDGLEDGEESRRRLESRAREQRHRRATRMALAAGAAWLLGHAVGDTLGALVRWVDKP